MVSPVVPADADSDAYEQQVLDYTTHKESEPASSLDYAFEYHDKYGRFRRTTILQKLWPRIDHRIPKNYTVITTDPYDIWRRYLRKNKCYMKAEYIYTMHQETGKHVKDKNIHVIHSYSSEPRNVDMLLFKCGCPNNLDICSHIIAAALRGRSEHKYLPKVAIMSEIRKRIRLYMQVLKLDSIDGRDIEKIASGFQNPNTSEEMIQVLLEILVGIAYRSSENSKKYGSYVKQLGEMFESEQFKNNEIQRDRSKDFMLKKAFLILDRMAMSMYVEDMEILSEELGAEDILSFSGYRNDYAYMYHGYKLLRNRVAYLIRSLGGDWITISPYNTEKRISILFIVVRRILEEELNVTALGHASIHQMVLAITKEIEANKNVKQKTIVMDGNAVGYDFFNSSGKARTLYDCRMRECTYSGMYTETRKALCLQIKEAPMLKDVRKYTLWDLLHQNKHGPMLEVLQRNELNLDEEFTFLSLNDGSIIKLPCIDGGDYEFLNTKIFWALRKRDVESFVIYGLCMLAKVKECTSKEIFRCKASLLRCGDDKHVEKWSDFLAESIIMIPDMLLIPFCEAYFTRTDLLNRKCIARMARYMNDAILKGRMSPEVKLKLLRVGIFYDLNAESEWEKAKKEAEKDYSRVLEAKKAAEAEKLAEEAKKEAESHKETTDGSNERVQEEHSQKQDEVLSEISSSFFYETDGSSSLADLETDDKIIESNIETKPGIDILNLMKEHVPVELVQPSNANFDATTAHSYINVSDVRGTTRAAVSHHRALIDEIRRKEFGVGIIDCPEGKSAQEKLKDMEILNVLEKQRRRIARSIKRLSEDLYTNRIHLQLELLQNADDNEYQERDPQVFFILDPEAIVVINNERGFSEKDVRSLCDIGASNKTDKSEKKIGKFGMGFKSVFLVTQEPHIFSNGYHFKFSSDPNMPNNVEYIMPHWVELGSTEGPYAFVRERLSANGKKALSKFTKDYVETKGALPKTLLYLPLKADMKNEDWKKFYAEFQVIRNLHLAFLRKLSFITFLDVSSGSTTTSSRKLVEVKNLLILIPEQERSKRDKHYGDGQESAQAASANNSLKCQRLDIITNIKLPNSKLKRKDLKLFLLYYNFHLTEQEQVRASTSKSTSRDCSVTVGIPIQEPEAEWPVFDIYNVLPIGPYGLPFVVNADFVISTSRESIIDDDPWNEILSIKTAEAFYFMMQTIAKLYLSVDKVYSSALRAIPGLYAGRGCMEQCCTKIHEILKTKPWVAVSKTQVVPPSQALILQEKIGLPAKMIEVVKQLFSPYMLQLYCNVSYAHKIVQSQVYNLNMLNMGINDFSPEFIITVLKKIKKDAFMSRPLKEQPREMSRFINDIGLLLYIFDKLASPEEVHDLRRHLIVTDTNGMLIEIDDRTMFVRDTAAFGGVQLERVVAPSVFENRWNLDGYGNRIAGVLELMGCVELTSSNVLSTLVVTKARQIINRKRSLDHTAIMERGRTILHVLARNHDKLDMLSPEDRETIRSIPVALENGDVASLNDANVKFCPNIYARECPTSLSLQVSMHFSTVRRFYADLQYPVKYLSNGYLEGIVNNDCSSDAVKFGDLRTVMTYLGVYTFVTFVHFDTEVDSYGKYSLPSTLHGVCEETINRCRNERSMELCKMATFNCSNAVVRDYYSPDFGEIATSLLGRYNSYPGGSASISKNIDDIKRNLEVAHCMAVSLYRIMEVELSQNKSCLSATMDRQGSSQTLGHSLLYHQLHTVPWLPYKQASFIDKAPNGMLWVPVKPIPLYKDAAFSSIFFIKRDPVVTSDILSKEPAPDTIEILQFLCEKIKENVEGKAVDVKPDTTGKVKFNFFGETNSSTRLAACFSRDTLRKCMTDCISELKSELGNLYTALWRQMQEKPYLAETLRMASICKELIVTFTKGSDLKIRIVTCTSVDKRLSISRSVVKHNDLLTLEEHYHQEFPQLHDFWLALGVNEFTSVETTLDILDKVTHDPQAETLPVIFTCVMHLYNVLDNATFIEKLWNKRCIPLTEVEKYMFSFQRKGVSLDMEKPENIRLVEPSKGLVALMSSNSEKMSRLFRPGGHNAVWTVMRPLEDQENGDISRYMEKYLRKVDFSKHQLWINVLLALSVTDFCDHLMMVPNPCDPLHEHSTQVGSHILVLLLPYAHHYLTCHYKNDYVVRAQRVLKMLRRLHVSFVSKDIASEIRFHCGENDVKGTESVLKKTLLHCDCDGTIRLYVMVENVPDVSDSLYGDILSSAKRLVDRRQLMKLPLGLFHHLARVLLADPDKTPCELNKFFFKVCSQEVMLGGMLSTVYEMMRLQSTDTLEHLVNSYNTGNVARCACGIMTKLFPPVGGANGNEQLKEDHETVVTKEGLVKDVMDVPQVMGCGSHIPTSRRCLTNAMEPFVSAFLLQKDKFESGLQKWLDSRNQRDSDIYSHINTEEDDSAFFGHAENDDKESYYSDYEFDRQSAVSTLFEDEPDVDIGDWYKGDSDSMSPRELQRRSQSKVRHTVSKLADKKLSDILLILENGRPYTPVVPLEPLAYMVALKDAVRQSSDFALMQGMSPEEYVDPEKMNKMFRESSHHSSYTELQRNHIVGLLGEEYVYQVLQEILKQELESKQLEVVWHNKGDEIGLSYDISVKNRAGETVYIEVKSSSSLRRNDFRISYSQWLFARDHGLNFEIFRICGIGQEKPMLLRIMNPYSLWRHGQMGFSVSII